jgi:alpha-galactosidase
MTHEIAEILTNKEAIAIDQDKLGQQGKRIRSQGGLEVWSKQLSDGSRAAALLNRSSSPAQISVSWPEIGFPDSLTASVRDVWAHTDASARGSYSTAVPAHGVVLVRIHSIQ